MMERRKKVDGGYTQLNHNVQVKNMQKKTVTRDEEIFLSTKCNDCKGPGGGKPAFVPQQAQAHCGGGASR